MHAVVRVLGVEAAFAERSALPGAQATLVVRTDAKTLTVQMLRSGPEAEPTYANDEIKGVPVGAPDPGRLERARERARRRSRSPIGADWPSGVYAARIDADDGRVGFAPLVVRPPAPRAARRGRDADEHLAGLQLLRRRRRRLGRHLVRALEDACTST